MRLKATFIVLAAFILGILSTLALTSFSSPSPSTSTTTYVVANAESIKEEAQEDSNFITQVLGMENDELPSPYDWITERNIHVDKDRVIITIDNAQWSKFTDTNSMDPVIDAGANAIQIIPESADQIHVGDIVSYNSKYTDGTTIHRVVEIGYDKEGWYCIMKGDNNSRNDPGKIRFDQIKRVTIAIIY